MIKKQAAGQCTVMTSGVKGRRTKATQDKAVAEAKRDATCGKYYALFFSLTPSFCLWSLHLDLCPTRLTTLWQA